MTQRRPSLIVGLVVASLLTTGCLGADAPVADPPRAEPPVPVPPPDEPPPGDPQGELVEPTPGMLDVRPMPWDEATVDGTTVTVSWWSGVEPCNVLDRVEVEADDEVVTLTLLEGTADREAACIEIGVRKRTEVELEEPVGQRSLVDGADPASG